MSWFPSFVHCRLGYWILNNESLAQTRYYYHRPSNDELLESTQQKTLIIKQNSYNVQIQGSDIFSSQGLV